MRQRSEPRPWLATRDSMSRGLVALAITFWLSGCGEAWQPLPEPPGLENFDPAVIEQHRQLATELDRALDAGDGSATELAEAYGRLGMWHQTYRLLDVAELAYGNARVLSPEDPRWPYFLGVMYENGGQAEKAEEVFRNALTNAPDSLAAKVRLAEVLYSRELTDEAAGLLEEAVAADPLCVRAKVSLAKVKMDREQPEQAVDLLEAALRLQSDSNEIRHSLGLAYRMAGAPERARAHLELAVSDGKEDYFRMADPWAQDLLDMDVGYSGSFRRGRDAMGRGRYQRALVAFEKAIEGNPGLIEGHLGKIRSLVALDREKDAYGVAKEMIELFPDDPRGHYALGEVCSHLPDRADEVESAYRAALDLNPDFMRAIASLSELEKKRGNREAAERLLARATELEPENASLLNRRARLLVDLGRTGEAIEVLKAGIGGQLDQPWGSRLLLEQLEAERAEGGA